MVFGGGWRGGGRFPRRGSFGGGPWGNPYGGGRYGGYQRRGAGGNLARNACLLEGGCCIGEALGGNCLVLALRLLPQLVFSLIHGRGGGLGTTGENSPAGGRLVGAIRVYQQQISPRLPGSCRLEPSCSHYAVQALTRHGSGHGSWLSLRRLVRCRPGGPRGHDPVPPARPAQPSVRRPSATTNT